MTVMGVGQDISEALGESGEARLISGGQPGDLRSAQIAKGLADQGMSVGMEASMGLHAGFNGNGVGLNLEGNTARPDGWEPDVGPEAPAADRANIMDNTFG